MSWIDGFCSNEDSHPLPPQVWGNLNSDYYRTRGKFKTAIVQDFTNKLNRIGYVLSPLVGIIRLIAALCYTISAVRYAAHNLESAEAQGLAYQFAGDMALRGLIELVCLGLFIGTIGDYVNDVSMVV